MLEHIWQKKKKIYTIPPPPPQTILERMPKLKYSVLLTVYWQCWQQKPDSWCFPSLVLSVNLHFKSLSECSQMSQSTDSSQGVVVVMEVWITDWRTGHRHRQLHPKSCRRSIGQRWIGQVGQWEKHHFDVGVRFYELDVTQVSAHLCVVVWVEKGAGDFQGIEITTLQIVQLKQH